MKNLNISLVFLGVLAVLIPTLAGISPVTMRF